MFVANPTNHLAREPLAARSSLAPPAEPFGDFHVGVLDRESPNFFDPFCRVAQPVLHLGRQSRSVSQGKFGLEASQVVLGHSTADVTQIYAERDFDLAKRVIRKMG